MPDNQTIASLESEHAVLGAILISPEKLIKIIELIRPEDFYHGANGIIYQAMLELFEADEVIDYNTVFSYLKDRGLVDKIGGLMYLMELSEKTPHSANIQAYAQIVCDKSTIRRLYNAALTIQKDCKNGFKSKPHELLESAQQQITAIFEAMPGKKSKNIAKRIREYTEVTEGNVEVTRLYKDLGLVTTGNKKAALMALGRMVKEGYIAKIKPGYYRVMEKDAIRLKLSDAGKIGGEWDIRYPFDLEKYFVSYHKTVVVVSGEPDAGKTAILLNIAAMNMPLAPIFYWTSEMGLPELYSRAENFEDFNAEVWDERIVFSERSENFADVVALYPDAIHIIDNLEMSGDDFKNAGGLIDLIWKALDKGIAFIGIHMDPGREFPVGGMQSVKRARLWMHLRPQKGGGNIMQVKKFKNWRDKLTNIKGKTFEYRLVRGCKIIELE